ncbi:type I-F CRISPR-associated protein Csy1 [Pseudolysobacter antarcticus]|uniref:Type I-F CRISPR-associated protein Csy1 n=1 Tax=Pseudolysobacter antarcticus TaxID=2511995 RepID=A0A411HG93_9GAMM|nr:type I-F CRISPR-associated protein Csy1 [Pseudolysobacter antarcticus]QBB69467.1 type I-F CRISPR-associated protein Csy1 [Pseudolysobacter antarcticus]
MTEDTERTTRSALFRSAITQFIHERRDAKLKATSEDTNETTSSKYEYGAWLADAARRVNQIQAVTHVLKATHPDARGSNLHAAPETLPAHAEIGTHVLGASYADDIVGNAAALDVYKLLKIEVDGKRLLDWMQVDDTDLLTALHDDVAVAKTWANAFKGLLRPVESWSSHEKAKQLYWCVKGEPTDNASYHLLQPMFSSTLTHAVHAEINDARFGESNKLARQAWRERKPHEGFYRDYRQLLARKLGGTKPQNISQLNSERGGVNYLLASLPPSWDLTTPKTLLKLDTALSRFARYEGVGDLVDALCRLLTSNPGKTMEPRVKREFIEQALGQSLAAFGAEISARFDPGWTRDDQCELPLCERLWLDPDRAELPIRDEYAEEDRAFIAAREWGDWPDEVAHRFGNWLNAILLEKGLSVGDAEHAHWARQAIVDAAWPVTMQRRAVAPTKAVESTHE